MSRRGFLPALLVLVLAFASGGLAGCSGGTAGPVQGGETGGRARNVVLFLADAGGIPTLHAASVHGYGAARRLFVQQMPHIALSDTSTAQEMVTDSAAGMTAIVTGQRTNNGVLSQSAAAVRGQRDGEPLETILEHAEERGLATGLVTNDSIAGATPAALYAKVNDRNATGPIVLQLFRPRFGDGPDVVIGAGRLEVGRAVAALGHDLDALAREARYTVAARLADVPAGARRVLVLHESDDFDLAEAVRTALGVLSRAPNGYFLMVESDVHTDRIRRGIERMVAFDRIVRETAAAVSRDTLVIFTADHSFDLRVHGGKWDQPLLAGLDDGDRSESSIRLPHVRMDNSHTGEEVLVAAQGPGAERVRGYMANTDLFSVMMRAYGWPMEAAGAAAR
jgi:alkaline phosphatase